MSTEDHPDWWRPVGGSNAQDSTLERRSLIWNDGDPQPPPAAAPSVSYDTYRGKFFTRGCRGMIEQIQVYCIGDGVDALTLRYSPHPCIGPVGEVTIVPAAVLGWQDFVIEEMWNYDSLFIWVHACTVNVFWAYDVELPYDGHMSDDVGATWSDLAVRPFFRVVYTGETPGDVPVSGIINNIPIPYSSSEISIEEAEVPEDVETTLVDVHGAGYCDYIEALASALANSHITHIRVYCDEILAGSWQFSGLNAVGHTTSTPTISLPDYAADGDCAMLIHKRFEFRRRLRISAYNALAAALVVIRAFPTLMR